MSLLSKLLAPSFVSITDLRKNFETVMNEAGNKPFAILNHNKPVAYVVPADVYEKVYQHLIQHI